jgi:hypothetical protein
MECETTDRMETLGEDGGVCQEFRSESQGRIRPARGAVVTPRPDTPSLGTAHSGETLPDGAKSGGVSRVSGSRRADWPRLEEHAFSPIDGEIFREQGVGVKGKPAAPAAPFHGAFRDSGSRPAVDGGLALRCPLPSPTPPKRGAYYRSAESPMKP